MQALRATIRNRWSRGFGLAAVLALLVTTFLAPSHRAAASLASPGIDFCGGGCVQTFGPLTTDPASGPEYSSLIYMPVGGGAMGVYANPGTTPTKFGDPSFGAGGT